jgi:hypothetical protein
MKYIDHLMVPLQQLKFVRWRGKKRSSSAGRTDTPAFDQRIITPVSRMRPENKQVYSRADAAFSIEFVAG